MFETGTGCACCAGDGAALDVLGNPFWCRRGCGTELIELLLWLPEPKKCIKIYLI